MRSATEDDWKLADLRAMTPGLDFARALSDREIAALVQSKDAARWLRRHYRNRLHAIPRDDRDGFVAGVVAGAIHRVADAAMERSRN